MIKLLSLLLIVSFFTVDAIAQKAPRGKSKMNIEQLKSDLNLSDDQVEQINKLRDSQKAKAEDLKKDENLSKEDKREKFRNLRESHKEAFEAILTSDQLDKLESLKKEKEADRKAEKSKMKEKRQEMREELKKLRAEFNDQITDDDKARIEELRQIFKSEKQNREKTNKGKENRVKEDREKRKAFMAEHEEEFMELKDLSEKYGPKIKEFLESKDFIPQGPGAEREMKGDVNEKARKGKQGRKRHQAARFLLMEFEATSAMEDEEEAEIKIFPNPASSWTMLNYDVRQDGIVTVQLKDDQGNLIQTYVNEKVKKGNYSLEINTSNLANKNYFIVVTDGKGVMSKQMVQFKN